MFFLARNNYLAESTQVFWPRAYIQARRWQKFNKHREISKHHFELNTPRRSKTNNHDRWNIGICVVGIVCILLIMYYDPDKKKCERYENILLTSTQQAYYGIVKAKSFNSKIPIAIKLDTNRTIIQNKVLYKILDEGDSIYSYPNSSIINIYKEEKNVKVDLDTVYDCDQSYIPTIYKNWVKLPK